MTCFPELLCNSDEWTTGKGQPAINSTVFIWGLLDIIKIWLDLFSIDRREYVRGELLVLRHSRRCCRSTNAADLPHVCGFLVSSMPLCWLLMTNIIYANVIRPGKTIAELRVPTEIYHRTRRDSKPSIKILDFSRLNLHVINKAGEERGVCRTTSWSSVSCDTPGKGKRSWTDSQVETMMSRSLSHRKWQEVWL